MSRLRPCLDVLLAVLMLGVFRLFPSIDLTVSRYFYTPGRGFELAETLTAQTINRGVGWLAIATAAVLGLLWLLAALGVGRWRARWRGLAFVSLSLMLGPWLAVNVGFKDNLGRPRPQNIVEFGGDAVYTPVLVPSDYCKRNCSFPSGHAGFGYWIASLAVYLRERRRRRLLFAAGLATGTLFGFVRILSGKHFVSDIVFAFFVVWFVSRLLAALLRRLAPAPETVPT